MNPFQTNPIQLKQKPYSGSPNARGYFTKTRCSIATMGALLSLGTQVSVMAEGEEALADAQSSVAATMENGDVSISYNTETPGKNYLAETTEDLVSPVEWTPLLNEVADSSGLVTFTDSLTGAQRFYRISLDNSAPPLVYTVENTGADNPPPTLPTLANLPTIIPLTDPFEWSDGSGRSTNFGDWKNRRAEIKAEFENYEVGLKPVRPADITASYSGGTLTVNVTVDGETLTLTSAIVLPSGDGPFPAVIGMNSGSGSLPSDIFSSRDVAQITFSHNQVTTYGSPQNTNPYYRLYPDLNINNTGQYSAWAWGVSRIIDGLELVKDDLPIDIKHLAVTGCSYAGKMALFSGAFDERIALTIAQESGGGGAAAWRVSETLGEVEKLGATSHEWFSESMFQFSGSNVSKLPTDHHELMALVAPRALLVLGNPDYTWLADESGYVSCRAAHEVWNTLGISDRFGFSIVGGHQHCALPNSQRPEVEAFVEKFLLDITDADTDVTKHPFEQVNYSRWTEWWGTGDPTFPSEGDAYGITLEAECATVGSNWDTLTDTLTSNGSYVTVTPGIESIAVAPTGSENLLTIPFTLTEGGDFSIYARLNCPSASDDSFWVKLDNGNFELRNSLGTSGWQWLKLSDATLTAGQHTLTIGYREDGALLDKIGVSTYLFAPEDMGQAADNLCNP